MKVGSVETTALSDAEKLAEVEREIKARWQVYPRLVKAGKISQALMDKRIAVLIAIRDELRERVERAKATQGVLL